MENKTSKYFKYAIGEILLVVIGILIALQINNWNERKQNKLKVDNLLQKVQKEIETDISEVVVLTKFYATKDSLLQLVLNNKLTKEDYQKSNSRGLHNLIFNEMNINLKNTGYTNLMRVQDIIPQHYDSILDQLSTLYNDRFVYFNEAEIRLEKTTSPFNEFLFEKYDWYSSQVPEHTNEKRIDYFLNNVRYKGMAKSYQSSAIKNYLDIGIKYAYEAIETYKQIDKVLNKSQPKSLFNFEVDSTLLDNYRTIFNQDLELIRKESRYYLIGETDTINIFPYDTNKFYIQHAFFRLEKANDSINFYTSGFENGAKPLATKID